MYFAGSGYGMLLSTLVPGIEAAMIIMPVLFLPLVTVGGMFANQNTVKWYFWPYK